jgi:hypothetical protein
MMSLCETTMMFNHVQQIAHLPATCRVRWQFTLKTCRMKPANHPAGLIFTCRKRLYTSLLPDFFHYFKFNKPGAASKQFPDVISLIKVLLNLELYLSC